VTLQIDLLFVPFCVKIWEDIRVRMREGKDITSPRKQMHHSTALPLQGICTPKSKE